MNTWNVSSSIVTVSGDHPNTSFTTGFQKNCTTLASLDLIDVFTKLSIGNEDYWGAVDTPYLALYYIHFIIFFTLLLIINCWCGLVLWEKVPSVKKHALLVYIVSTYCVWAFTSVVHYVLITIDLNCVTSRQLASTAKLFETLSVASLMNNLLVTAVYQFYLLRYKHSIYKYKHIFCGINIPSILTTFVIVVMILTANGPLLAAVVILTIILLLIGTAGTTLFIINYTKLWVTIKEIKYIASTRQVIVRGLLRVLLGYMYLVLLSYHLTAPLIKVASNDKCVEDAEGKRSTWLIVQSLLKVFELVLVLLCLISHVPQRIEKLFKQTVKESKKIQYKGHSTKHEVVMFSSLVQEKSKAVTSNNFTSDCCFSETNKSELQNVWKNAPLKTSEIYGCVSLPAPKQVKCVSPMTCSTLEYEHLPHSCDVDYNGRRETCLQLQQMECDPTHKPYRWPVDDFSTFFVEFNYEPVSVSSSISIPRGMSVCLYCVY